MRTRIPGMPMTLFFTLSTIKGTTLVKIANRANGTQPWIDLRRATARTWETRLEENLLDISTISVLQRECRNVFS